MKRVTAFLCALAVWFAPLAIANQFAALLVGSVAQSIAQGFERFENTLNQTWTAESTPESSYITGRGAGSTYALRKSASSVGQGWSIEPGESASWYIAGWFRVSTDSLSDTATLDIVRVGTATDDYECASLVLVKSGSQLQVRLDYYDNGGASATAQNITAGTWYHFGIYYQDGTDAYAWYLSTTASLGSAISSGSIATSRTPGRLAFGFIAASGTWGVDSTVVDFDSFDRSTSSLVANCEEYE